MPVPKKKRITAENALSTSEASSLPLPEQQEFHQHLRALASSAVRTVLELVMREELDAFIGAAWGECSPKRKGYRNGTYTRDLATATGRLEDLNVPRDREGQFHTQVFDRYSRFEPHIAEGVTQMFVSGTSTHKVGEVAQTLLGVAPSASAVSRLNHTLTEQFEAWRCRPLPGHWRVLYLDGIYFRSASWRPGRPHHHFSGHGRRSGRHQGDSCHPGVRPRKSRRLAGLVTRPAQPRGQRRGSHRDRRT